MSKRRKPFRELSEWAKSRFLQQLLRDDPQDEDQDVRFENYAVEGQQQLEEGQELQHFESTAETGRECKVQTSVQEELDTISDENDDAGSSESSGEDGPDEESGLCFVDNMDSSDDESDVRPDVIAAAESVHQVKTGSSDTMIDDRPLYAGAPLTVADSLVAVLALVIRHNLTGVCLADVLLLINLHFIKENNLFKKTAYRIGSYFKRSTGAIHKHFFVWAASVALLVLQTIAAHVTSKSSYFVTLSIIDQLQELLLRASFLSSLGHRFHRVKKHTDNIEDIYDGALYKRMSEKNLLSSTSDLSFMWYTDGVPVFKSTKCSMWPLYLVINELSYKERFRKENLILAGLWVGKSKPKANLFVNALASELAQLKSGVKLTVPSSPEKVSFRAVLLCGTCDLPAKSQFLNLTQFNGYFGCPCCEIKGERVQLPNGNSVHAYRYDRDSSKLRTSKQTSAYSEQAIASGQPVQGVKGISVFSKLMPDFMMGMCIDSMHGVYSGVIKKLLELWFDSSFSCEAFSLSAVIKVIDDRLAKLLPPNFVERLPRSITDLCHWKATEFRSWFFYYSSVLLHDVMKPEYFKHYLSLLRAIALLNSDSVSLSTILHAKELLNKFVKDFEFLYGARFCTINIHQLLHLPECVENMGPLWVYSCFRFEDINGQFVKLVHGTNYICSQICRSHWYRLTMPRYVEGVHSEEVKDLFARSHKKRLKINVRISDNCSAIGSRTLLCPVPENIRSLKPRESERVEIQ